MRYLGYGIVLFLSLSVPAKGDSTAEALARLRNVGREGAGNEAASRAWKEVVAQGPKALPAILQTMDDADATAANWLRTAVDTIAERALAAGQTLPTDALEQFVHQTKHNSAARRLAYEWLCRVDPKTPDRLLPGMLQDPSPELRRDAVAAVIKQAKARRDKGDADGARTAYRKALTGAGDKDQVDLLVEQLDKLGVKVDVAGHFGFVRQWLLVAPFDNHNDKGFNVAYPPEKDVDPQALYKGKDGVEARWVSFTSKDRYSKVDLNKALGKHMGAVAYAYAVIDSPAERAIQIRAGSPNALKFFLNGKEVYHLNEYHHGNEVDQHIAHARLKAGRNELLVKVCQNEQKDDWAQDWCFQVRLCDAAGTAVAFTPLPVKANRKQGEAQR
jgi:hypothetical protein